ncbi:MULTISPECIES: MCE family protein [unclassified Gordonia (in: high G+C Gram-positive bacteria)]|uniref:MCE family protein n=1 Tax=unclassified Gordonia (in: high G+C Gram-positive bacteria) TaxID=2657482 RepID=UPI0020005079|nr:MULTISPECIES: MCE family protein [unclassified Gordonia (in: high G+C Gram-positive bacteria)]UQE75611.1 MCE family protein [Gordonia sp. PP30]
MKITSFVRGQLIIFALVTVVAVVSMAVFYIRIPQMVGIGAYRVTLDMPSSGGLYQNANVSFRGVDVGKVTKMWLTENRVQAELSIDSGTKIPANSSATVRSVSAVGEQFVEFLPPTRPADGTLGDGAKVTMTDEQLPVQISSMLDQADALLVAVGNTQLRQVLDEAFLAFNGTGPALQRLLDSMILFVGAANKNVDAVNDLIDQAGPILATQNRTADDIRSWTRDMTTVTDTLRAHKTDITGILQKGPGTATAAQKLFGDISQSFPTAISNLSVDARTMAIYLPNLRQTIVLYPRVLSALITAINTGNSDRGPNVNFTLGFQDPPTCTVGFIPPADWRFPSAQTPQQVPAGTLCRLPQNAQAAVRGARNFPCAEFPGRRAPTPAECRTGYKPSARDNVAFPNGLPFTNLPKQPAGYLVPGTPQSYDPTPATYATTYDPVTGQFIGPDGKIYNAGLGEQPGAKTQWYDLITKTVES